MKIKSYNKKRKKENGKWKMENVGKRVWPLSNTVNIPWHTPRGVAIFPAITIFRCSIRSLSSIPFSSLVDISRIFMGIALRIFVGP